MTAVPPALDPAEDLPPDAVGWRGILPGLAGALGAGCVGKTTLAAAIAATRPDVTVVAEAARDWFAAHPTPERDRFRFPAQAAIQTLALAREQEAAPGPVVCDRSPLCAAVYVHSTGDRLGGDALYRRAQGHLAAYRRIWLLDPADVSYAADAVRAEDTADRARIHAAYVERLAAWRVPYRLLGGTLAERAAAVLADLRGALPGAHPDDRIAG